VVQHVQARGLQRTAHRRRRGGVTGIEIFRGRKRERDPEEVGRGRKNRMSLLLLEQRCSIAL
jgi:hypothetical protein